MLGKFYLPCSKGKDKEKQCFFSKKTRKRKHRVNLGLGVKKILNGQIERANGDTVDEMYLSGNLGVKYKF